MNLRDALPNEPGKRNRPCVVVENPKVFGDYANVIVVPLTHDRAASFSLVMTTIDPTPENGCDGRCYAVSAHVASSLNLPPDFAAYDWQTPMEYRFQPERRR
jgi:hypothetical protein